MNHGKCWKILLKWIIKENDATAENTHNARLKEIRGKVWSWERIHFTGQGFQKSLRFQNLSKLHIAPLLPAAICENSWQGFSPPSGSPLWKVNSLLLWQLFTEIKILEIHLTISGLLFACVDVDTDFKFYFHLLLQNIRQLLKIVIQTASWYSALGKSESEIL